MKLVSILLIAMALNACGPGIAIEDLPEIPSVETGDFLPVVADQLGRLRQAVADRPGNAGAAGELGLAYLAYSQDAAAEAALRRASLLDPSAFEWRYYRAEALTRLGKFGEAAELLEIAAGEKPRYFNSRIRLGSLYLQLGELDKARMNLLAVVKAHPESTEARLELARLHLRADEPDEAIEQLDLLAASGHSGQVYFALAEAWRRKGDATKAAGYMSLFEKYGDTGVGTTDSLLVDIGRLDLSDTTLLRRAARLQAAGNTDEAIELMHQALERNPAGHLTHAALVGAYGALGQFEKADEHYRLALELAPPTAPLLRNLGRARIYEKRLAEAREALEAALEINPSDASALAFLGVVDIAQGKAEAGIAKFQRALELNPNETLARHNLAEILYKQGRFQEALLHLEAIAEPEGRHTPRVWRLIGESYMIAGDTERAREAFAASIDSATRLDNLEERKRSERLLGRIAR